MVQYSHDYVSPFNHLFMIEVHGTTCIIEVASIFFTTGCL